MTDIKVFNRTDLKVREIKKKMISFRAVISVLFIVTIIGNFLTLSCGYHFKIAGESTGVYFDSIAIPMFSSTSSYLGVEGEFTKIVRKEFLDNSNIRIENKDKAQAVLSGRIYSITAEPLTYTITQSTVNNYIATDEVTRSRKLKVSVDVILIDRITGKVIWQDSNLTGEAAFAVSADPLTDRYNQRQALISIARDLATKIYSRTMERF